VITGAIWNSRHFGFCEYFLAENHKSERVTSKTAITLDSFISLGPIGYVVALLL